MAVRQPKYPSDEFARRGEEMYSRLVRPRLRPEDNNKFVALDIDSGEFEIDERDITAINRLLLRKPDAQTWLSRAGDKTAYKLGARFLNPIVEARRRASNRPMALLALLFLTALSGCSKETETQKSADPAGPPKTIYEIGVLGDESRLNLLNSLASAHSAAVIDEGQIKAVGIRHGDILFHIRSSAAEKVSLHAGVAWRADVVFIAVDATTGPLPIHREHVLVSRQAAAPVVAIAFTNGRQLNSPQLLQLEETEMREVLETYDLSAATPCVYDDADVILAAGSSGPCGPTQIIGALGGFATKRGASPPAAPEATKFRAAVYSLAAQEAFSRDVACVLGSGSATVIIGGNEFDVTLTAQPTVGLGSSGEIDIEFTRRVRHPPVQRFLLVRNGHVQAVGSFIDSHQSSNGS